MSTTEDDEPEEKKYCCGNSAQNEAGYVSKCDLALVVNGLVFYVLVTVLLFVGEGEDNVLKSYVNNNPGLSDLNNLISADMLPKLIFLGAAFMWLIFELGLAILLLRGSSMRDKQMLKNWFHLTIFVSIIGITISGFAVYYLKEKQNIGVGAFIYYMYKWYGLWICTELLKEIKQGIGINSYAMPMDFGTSF